MEYISVEKFLKLPKEVQDIFWNWWKPSKGDINYSPVRNGIEVIEIENNSNQRRNLGYIPFLTEGPLRKFIENKTEYRVDCCLYEGTYDINICENNGLYIKKYEDIDKDLLQAYWKVAVQIAEQEVQANADRK